MIEKYIEAYKEYYETVKEELTNEKKVSHWMWFIFPQLKGLGKSSLSNLYGLNDLQEARAFLTCAYLNNKINSLLKIILKYKNVSLIDVFGELDALKFHSCITLFYLATNKKIFKKILEKYFSGVLDNNTILLLNENNV